jgi:hypothetical protein
VIQWREGRVVREVRRWSGAVEYEVDVAGGPGSGGTCRALAYPALVGLPRPGELVLLNTTALERGLGTGGLAFVVAVPDRIPVDPVDPVDPVEPVDPAAGPPPRGMPRDAAHLVKGRYTPLQAMVAGVDEQGSPYHDLLRDADDLSGLPVVVADLHSALPAVVAGIRERRPGARVAYVMTDGGALPAWFSRTVAGLREAGWLATCVTAGQAFGGDLEAVSVHTALLAARLVAGADLAVVTQGPGNLGTGTRWGFSGVAAGEAVNAAGVLRGRPVAALRVSGADPRDRHRGVSHHSLTALGRVALVPAEVAVPVLDGDLGARVRSQAGALGPPHGRHRLVEVPVDGLREALDRCPVPLSTMGRGLDADEPAFLAAAAAGRLAATAAPPPDLP